MPPEQKEAESEDKPRIKARRQTEAGMLLATAVKRASRKIKSKNVRSHSNKQASQNVKNRVPKAQDNGKGGVSPPTPNRENPNRHQYL